MATEIKTEAKALAELAQEEVNAIVPPAKITSQPTYNLARESLLKVKGIQKEIKKTKDSIIKPITEAVKNIRGLFAPAEKELADIEEHIKGGIVKYSEKLEAEQAKREIETEEKLENGVEMEKATELLHNTTNKINAVKTRKIPKVRITDKTKIPLEYLILNEKEVRPLLIAGGKIDGVELYYETIAVGV